MTKYIFTRLHDETNPYDRYDITLTVHKQDIKLPELLENIEDFLRGSGFHVEMGSLHIEGMNPQQKEGRE